MVRAAVRRDEPVLHAHSKRSALDAEMDMAPPPSKRASVQAKADALVEDAAQAYDALVAAQLTLGMHLTMLDTLTTMATYGPAMEELSNAYATVDTLRLRRIDAEKRLEVHLTPSAATNEIEQERVVKDARSTLRQLEARQNELVSRLSTRRDLSPVEAVELTQTYDLMEARRAELTVLSEYTAVHGKGKERRVDLSEYANLSEFAEYIAVGDFEAVGRFDHEASGSGD